MGRHIFREGGCAGDVIAHVILVGDDHGLLSQTIWGLINAMDQ